MPGPEALPRPCAQDGRPASAQAISGQQGSVTVAVAFLLPILLLMLMLILNIGQMVYEKLRLQNAADACALSAATVQAAGLNEIADLNLQAEIEYAKMLFYLIEPPGFWKTQSDGTGCIDHFKEVFKAIREYQDEANEYFAKKALEAAKWAKKRNLDRIGVTGVSLSSINPTQKENGKPKLMEYRENTRPAMFLWVSGGCAPIPCMIPVKSWIEPMAGDARHVGPHRGIVEMVVNANAVETYETTVKPSITKKKKPLTYSAFRLSQRPRDYILGASDLFGRMRTLEAYAAAMPSGGSAAGLKATYEPAMVRLNAVNPRPQAPDIGRVLH